MNKQIKEQITDINRTETQNPYKDTQVMTQWRMLWKPILLLAIVITLFTIATMFGLGEKLGDLKNWISSLGSWGPVAYLLIYLGATITAIPGTILGIIALDLYTASSSLVSPKLLALLCLFCSHDILQGTRSHDGCRNMIPYNDLMILRRNTESSLLQSPAWYRFSRLISWTTGLVSQKYPSAPTCSGHGYVCSRVPSYLLFLLICSPKE